MSKIILVRHAQASLGKSNYDALSDIGYKQSAILGQYLNKFSLIPEEVITGSLNRHQQTANEIIKAFPRKLSLQEDTNWDEFDFKKLIQLFLHHHPEETPEHGDIRAFFTVLKKSMLAWSTNELDNEKYKLESWTEFSNRVQAAINSVLDDDKEKTTLIISSGGAIAMTLMKVLGVNPKTMINLNFQIRNTSFTELNLKAYKQELVAFNQINHLIEYKDKGFITYA